MKIEHKKSLFSFGLQLVIYGGLILVYLFGVLYFLGDWIFQIEEKSRHLYAVLSLLLIIAQGLILESLTTALLNFIHPKIKD